MSEPRRAAAAGPDAGSAGGLQERLRREHVAHETRIQSIGVLHLVGGIAGVLGGCFLVAVAVTDPPADTAVGARARVVAGPPGVLLGLGTLVLGVLHLWVGRGLRRLEGWVRAPVGILSGLGLLGSLVAVLFGDGLLAPGLSALVSGYVLHCIFGAKGRLVLSPEYRRIAAQTPDVRYAAPTWAWILLVLLTAFVVFITTWGAARV